MDDDRFRLIDRTIGSLHEDFANSVRTGLCGTPKRLECRFFYDMEGSRLFEAICEAPEYYLTRAEREIAEQYAPEIVSALPAGVTLAELGSGNAAKTRFFICAILQRQPQLRYVPMDISRGILEESSRALLRDCPGLTVCAIAGEYRDALRELTAQNDPAKLLLWLGSNIGNLDRDEAAQFLREVRAIMNPRDALVVGMDLRKDRAMLEKAYDDAAGITAKFNLNLLSRINSELGGHFDLTGFHHRAVYNEAEGRVEMYLVSTRTQQVAIDGLRISVCFESGEPIHTENSYKHSLAEIGQLAAAAGFEVARQWFDAERRFSENLFIPSNV